MGDRFDLGGHTRAIKTVSTEAQRWFNLGLNWCFGFNQEEGVKCFHEVLKHDLNCAMAHWGMAYGAGPFYNLPWRDFGNAEAEQATALCHHHVTRASELAEPGPEADLIAALAKRFQQPHPVSPEDYDAWDGAYAAAMREVYKAYPEDLDLAALFAEAAMTRTPWKLWNTRTGEPAPGADTLEVINVLERAIRQADEQDVPQHPAILHLHIHALEMSNEPEAARRSADVLGTLCPDAGHMNHMPGHIYVLCGQYEKAKQASVKAIQADRLYGEYAGPYKFYTTARCHDLHLMMFTCMFLGQFQPAMEAATEMCGLLTPDVLTFDDKPQMTITMEGYHSMMVHVLVRFGKWREITDWPLPDDQELYCVSTAMIHYARIVAHAALGEFEQAEEQRQAFYTALGRISADRVFFNNSAVDILAVAEGMLEGELAYYQGKHEEAYVHLREAVARCDAMAYSEPWAWMHPPRHALGALLCAQGHYEEAEQVYRADLGLSDELPRCCQHPDNIWALHGLAECLEQRGETAELAGMREKLEIRITAADFEVSSSCCCRRNSTGMM